MDFTDRMMPQRLAGEIQQQHSLIISIAVSSIVMVASCINFIHSR